MAATTATAERVTPLRIAWALAVLVGALGVGFGYLTRRRPCGGGGGKLGWWDGDEWARGLYEALWLLAAACTLALGAREVLADSGRPARTAVRDLVALVVSVGLYTLVCCDDNQGLHHLTMAALITLSVALPVGGLLWKTHARVRLAVGARIAAAGKFRFDGRTYSRLCTGCWAANLQDPKKCGCDKVCGPHFTTAKHDSEHRLCQENERWSLDGRAVAPAAVTHEELPLWVLGMMPEA